MHRITSRHNARVKDAAKLRQRRQREKQQRFLIDGIREIIRAVQEGFEPIDAFLRESVANAAPVQSLASDLAARGAAVSMVADEVYDKLSFGDRADGVVVVARSRRYAIDDLRLPPKPLIAVMEGLEKPGNVGAVLRSADGAGVDASIVANPRTDVFNPNTIRTSLGTVFSKSVCSASSEAVCRSLRERGVAVYAARPEASRLYTDVDLASAAAIVLGNETEGLSAAWDGVDVVPVRLPMCGIADSLNVSAAAAAMFYERVDSGTQSQELDQRAT